MAVSDWIGDTDVTFRPCPAGIEPSLWAALEQQRIERAWRELKRKRLCFGCNTWHALIEECPERVLRGIQAADTRAAFGDFERTPTEAQRLTAGMQMLSDEYEPE